MHFAKKLLLLIAVISCKILPAQQPFVCGWQKPSEHKYKLPDAGNHPSPFQQLLKELGTTDADSIYTLPVVVHIIHTGGAVGSADNPSDAQVNVMLLNLNNAFRKNGALYGGADIKIQFQLAIKSPGCVSTTGINRVNGSSVTDYASGGIAIGTYGGSADEEKVKALSKWPNTDYINIWIVNKINGSYTAPGGFAYFPEYNSANSDGLTLLAGTVDGSNKTIVHEMGHYFNLYHSFYDGGFENSCAVNNNCAVDGDKICDTEPQLLEYFCSNNQNPCNGNLPYAIADTSLNYTVLNNYMGYTNCQWMFTADQKIRMRAALFAFRHGLINSGALSLPADNPPATACIPAVLPTSGLSPYWGIQQIVFNTLSIYSNSSLADSSFYIDRTCNQRTTVYKGSSYTLTVTGSYENPHTFKAYIDYNNDGDFLDAGESLLTDYAGITSTLVTIPLNAPVLNSPLRMRIVADNPAPGYPTYPSSCNLNGTEAEGAGQVEDIAIIIKNREIISIASGSWNNAATWNCNCVPQADDNVTIKNGHTINLNSAMGLQQCGILILQAGAVLNNATGNLQINDN